MFREEAHTVLLTALGFPFNQKPCQRVPTGTCGLVIQCDLRAGEEKRPPSGRTIFSDRQALWVTLQWPRPCVPSREGHGPGSLQLENSLLALLLHSASRV